MGESAIDVGDEARRLSEKASHGGRGSQRPRARSDRRLGAQDLDIAARGQACLDRYRGPNENFVLASADQAATLMPTAATS